MEELIQKSLALIVFLTLLFILLLWLYIKSAVKHGTKEAIMESYKIILEIENDPVKKANFIKTDKQAIEEEMSNW